MANGLLKKLAFAGIVGASAIFGAKEARAVPISWSSMEDIFYDASVYPDGASANYIASSINFRDQNGNVIVNNPNFSLVYIVNYSDGSSAIAGGLDGSGNFASGWFNQQGEYDTGLTIGQTANYTEGNVDNGIWKMFVDTNGDGDFGTYDSSNGLFIPDGGEMINNSRVANFQGFQTGVGTLLAGDISGWYSVPEPSSLTLLSVGVAALALRRRRKSDK